MSMMEKFLQMMRSTLQSYTGETLTHERSENEEENDESKDKKEATTDGSMETSVRRDKKPTYSYINATEQITKIVCSACHEQSIQVERSE